MKYAMKLMVLGLLALSMQSCKFLYKQPAIEKIHDLKVISINPEKTTLELSISVHNPNCYKLKLNEMKVNLLSQDRTNIGSAVLKNPVEIPKKKSNALTFNITLETRPTIRMVNHSDQTVFLYINGTGVGRVLGSNKKFEFEEPYELDIAKHLEGIISRFQADGEDIFKIKRAYISKVGLTESQVTVDFLILNPYGLKFSFSRFPSSITIAGKESGAGDLVRSMSFDEKVYSQEGSMLFRISNWKAVLNAAKGALNGEIPYEVKGEVQISAYGMQIKRPFTYKDSISVNITEEILRFLKD